MNRIKRLKTTFKELLAKYEKEKTNKVSASWFNNFGQPRSSSKQEFSGQRYQQKSANEKVLFPPYKLTMTMPWRYYLVVLPPCPTWGFNNMSPPQMHSTSFHSGCVLPRGPVFDKSSYPNNDHFNRRNRSNNKRENKVVRKVYHVKDSSNSDG